MSSDLQTALGLLQLNNYASVVLITAVVYDYFLTLFSEIEYIWCRPWTWVSALFILVRYFGLCWAITTALPGSTFLPGPTEISLYVLGSCIFPIFIAAANLVMILRVYAIWNQSRRILIFLLVIFVPEVVSSIIFLGIYSNLSTHVSVTLLQLTDKISICNIKFINTSMLLFMYLGIPRLVLGTALLVLTVVRAIGQLVEMHKATKQWRMNQCIQQLVRDGIIYFLIGVLYNVAVGFNREPSVNNIAMLMLDMACTIALATLMPRFIIGVRELYDPYPLANGSDDWQAMDSGFRLLPRPIFGSSGTFSTNVIMDTSPGWQGLSGEETVINLADAVAMEMLRDYMRRL